LNIAPDTYCRDYNYVTVADGECYYMGGNSVAVWQTQGDCRGKFFLARYGLYWVRC
jgi:hypothetical protein